MNPEDQLNKIIEHLSELQDATLSLNDSIKELSDMHQEMQSPESGTHEDIVKDIENIRSNLSDKMAHTEQMVSNLLDPNRMDQLTIFMKAMDDAMKIKINTEE